MLRTLIVGLGRSGRGLHLPVLRRARASASTRALFCAAPIVAVDPRTSIDAPAGTLLARSLDAARELMDPATTVAHLCTPPATRPELLDELGRRGIRRVIVEKPLALDCRGLARVELARKRWSLQLVVVAPWLASELTARILDVLQAQTIGSLRAVYVVQRKPRFARSLATADHPSAFDVELPHSVAVALALAGSARVVEAAATDLTYEGVVKRAMGGAALTLEHDNGVRTELRSDICAMVRERRITLEGERGTIVGHYPSSADDDTARLTTTVGLDVARSVFRDDALTRFIVGAYAGFATGVPDERQLALHAETVRLLDAAKRACERSARTVDQKSSREQLRAS